MYNEVPLHNAADFIRAFHVAFEAGIQYFSKKKGISVLFYMLDGGGSSGSGSTRWSDDETPFQRFQRAINGTPFQRACEMHGPEKVKKVTEDTLTKYHLDTPLDIADALLYQQLSMTVYI